jgi:hypothetical protein
VQTDIRIRDSSIPLHLPKPKTKLVLDIQAVGIVRSLFSRPSIIDSRDCFPRARCSIYRASRRGNLFDMSVLFRIAPAVCLCYSRASVWSNRRELPPTGNESGPPQLQSILNTTFASRSSSAFPRDFIFLEIYDASRLKDFLQNPASVS